MRSFFVLSIALLLAVGCSYAGLLRPRVVKQLNPDVVNLVNELAEVDQPNKDIIARLFPHGGLEYAVAQRSGLMTAAIRVPKNQFIWKPSIIVMPHSGRLELDITNEDQNLHGAYLPSNGDRQLLMLPMHTRGKVQISLDQPGLYWFGCPVANHAGRGMLGLIIVRGETPASAKLERPKQERP